MQYKIKPNKIILYVFIAVLFVQLISALVNIQLFQDGGSYLFEILQTKSPAIRHHRITVTLFQLPTVVLVKVLNKFSGIKENLTLVRIVFCVSYSLIPIAALILCWTLVRKKNEQLFIWPVITILFINLVNFSCVSELLIALQLSSPLVIGCLTAPKSKFFLTLLIILLPVIFFLHPLVAGLLIMMSIVAFYTGYKNRQVRSAVWTVAAVSLILAALRYVLNLYQLTDYENSFLNTSDGNSYLFETSFENKIFLFISVLMAFGCLLNQLKKNRKLSFFSSIRSTYSIIILLASLAGILQVVQYAYREFPLKTGLAVFATMLVYLMMAIDSAKKVLEVEVFFRYKLIMAIALIFSLVILSKAFIWKSSIEQLKLSLSQNSSACIELNTTDFNWLKDNPYRIVNTWALPSLALIVQDNQPRKLLLEKGNCVLYYQSAFIKFDQWTTVSKEYVTPSLR